MKNGEELRRYVYLRAEAVPKSEAAFIFDRARGRWDQRPRPRRRLENKLLAAGLALAMMATILLASAVHSLVSTAGTIWTWSVGPSLTTGREDHTATLLKTGRVLVSGGEDGRGHLVTTAELYDPKTNQWSPAGTVATPRIHHTATLLPSGKVLVVGGLNYLSEPTLASAELYDPGTNTWSTAPPMSVGRAWHTATLMRNGRVLVVGGLNWDPFTGGSPPNHPLDAEIYDPVSNRWSPAGQLSAYRAEQTATLLADGRVLVAGGHGMPPVPSGRESGHPVYAALASAEIYDPLRDRWVKIAPMTKGRYGQTASLLANGEVLLIGGQDRGIPTGTGELYDPRLDRWSPVASMAIPRIGHTATVLRNGTVLAVGNAEPGTSLAEIYNPASNRWSIASRPMQRYLQTSTALADGKVLVIGGYGLESLRSLLVYDPNGTPTTPAAAATPPVGGILLAILLSLATAGLMIPRTRQALAAWRRRPRTDDWITD